MNPWFIATEPFSPHDGERWHKYIEWSGLNQLTEVVSLDPMLCPPVLTELKDEYWPHIVNEDFMLNYFVDLEFLKREIANVSRKNLLCVLRNPSEEPARPPIKGFQFLGYDLVDVENTASALTNCGGFPEVFANSELSPLGLLTDFKRAVDVQGLLRSRHPEEIHANCHLWAIFRYNLTGVKSDLRGP
jgi:hypothetical protein